MTVEAIKTKVFKDDAGEWRWTASDSNGEKVATSGEGYKNQSHAVQAVMDLFPDTIVEIDKVDES